MQAFFELIEVTTGKRAALSETLNEAQWETLLQQIKEQTLIGPLYYGVTKLPKEQQPDAEFMLSWCAMVERIKQINRRMNAAAVKLYARLKQDGFNNVLLKGQGVAQLYPDPLLRTPGDLDYWIAGGREKVVDYVRHYFPTMPVVYHHMDFPVFKDVSVEAHFMPSWMYSYFTNKRLQAYFSEHEAEEMQHEVELPEGAGRIAVSSVSFNRIYILVHTYRHLLDEGVGLRQVLDYYFVLKHSKTDAATKAETVRVLRRLKMLRFAAAMMYVQQELFGLEDEYLIVEPNEREGRFFLDEIMEAGNFGHHDRRYLYKGSDKESRKHYFFRKQRRNSRFLTHYPSEVLWHPVFRIWQYFWRRKNGYL